MTPAARVQAAIEILDIVLEGQAAEKTLTGWARRSRYAGSKDRAAVRDLVFDALRNLRSSAASGGGMTGRAVMLGELRRQQIDEDAIFCGMTYAPAPLSAKERDAGWSPAPGAEALDIPDWLWPQWQSSLGPAAEQAAIALKSRAPVCLRVNRARGLRTLVQDALLTQGVTARPHPAAGTALEVIDGARRIRQSDAYISGQVELQDAGSQAVVETLPLRDGMRVLDFCAGGGGKALAMAARAGIELFAHDADPRRMQDLSARADRAGVRLHQLTTSELSGAGLFDLVLCDAPCSGSGAWRRSPDGKWRLSEAQLEALVLSQAAILQAASECVSGSGVLAYATCSVLDVENHHQIDRFVRQQGRWQDVMRNNWPVQNETDGFFVAHLTRVVGES